MTMRRIAAATVVAPAFFVLAGCATATIEDAVPAGALAQTQSGPAAPASAYPDLNVEPAVAAPQISPQEKAQQTTALRARREQLAREGSQKGVSDDGEALRRLAGSHADEVLKEIEGE